MSKTTKTQRAIAMAFSLLVGFTTFCSTADAQPTSQPQRRSSVASAHATRCVPDTLMVMAARDVTDEQLQDIADGMNCKIGDVIGKGAYRILVLKTPKGRLVETEKALKKDSHIWMTQRDFVLEETAITSANEDVVKSAKGGSGSFISLVKADDAWKLGTTGTGQTIAVMDSGCQSNIDELSGKADPGYDATTIDAKLALLSSPIGAAAGLAVAGPVGMVAGLGIGLLANVASNAVNPGAKTDRQSKNSDGDIIEGHGTMVSTVAVGAINGKHACGIAPGARVYPIRGSSSIDICAGIWHMMTTGGPKILNISQGPLADSGDHPIDHMAFKLYHDSYGGIIFLSAGNHGEMLPSKRMDYINVISMTDTAGKFIETDSTGSGSALGGCVTFTAQGQMVDCVNRFGIDESTGGTSLSSPACAGVAALVWQANPKLTNTQVELIMKQHAYVPSTVKYDATRYGYGIPDAKASVEAAQGLYRKGLGG